MSEIKRYNGIEADKEGVYVLKEDHDTASADYDKILAELHQESIEKDKTIADLKRQLEDVRKHDSYADTEADGVVFCGKCGGRRHV